VPVQDVDAGDLTQRFSYDDLGDLTYNSSIGTYTYPASGPNGCGTGTACAGPHANAWA
jgi:hypothetical protein